MSYIISFALLFFVYMYAVQGEQETSKLDRDDRFTDQICNVSERVITRNGISAIQCAVLCHETQGCMSMFHSNLTHECHGCSKSYTTVSETLPSPGMLYYVLDKVASTCLDHLHKGSKTSGVYTLETPLTNTVLRAYCDMTTDGGGWTVWQRRFNGSVSFVKTFEEYERGFGDPTGEYWLGLTYLFEYLSTKPNNVYLQFTDFSDFTAYELYPDMMLSPPPLYTVTMGSLLYSNTSGAGFEYNRNMPFSTFDKVQNNNKLCVKQAKGGWWFYRCTRINPNGWYGSSGTQNKSCIINAYWRYYASLKGTKLMIREKT